jgi:uncharacterized Zn finger protein (UPF0148 family)
MTTKLGTAGVRTVLSTLRRWGSRPCPTCGHPSVAETSQAYFADAILTTSASSLSRWRHHEYDLTDREIERLAALMAIPLTDLRRLARRVDAGKNVEELIRAWDSKVRTRHDHRAQDRVWNTATELYVPSELHRPTVGQGWKIADGPDD